MKTGKITAAVLSFVLVLTSAAQTAGAVAVILGVDPFGNDVIGGLYDELVGFNEEGTPVIRQNFPEGVDKSMLPDDALVYNEKYIYITGEDSSDAEKADGEKTASSEAEQGDINNDGSVDLTDLTELSLALIGDRKMTDEELLRADVDRSGRTDLADLAHLRQYLSKVIASL